MSRAEYELIGDDCAVYTGDLAATELVGDGTKTLEELAGGTAGGTTSKGFYLVTAMASAASFFPSGLAVGEMIPMAGSEVLTVGDKVKKLTLTKMGDASGWSGQASQSEVAVTRLSHSWNKYRYGKKDFQGTINSITTLGISDEETGTIGRAFKLFRKTAAGAITISNPDGLPVYFIGYIRETTIPGETNAFMFAQVNISAGGLGGAIGSAQSHDLSFRLAGNDPVFYSIDVAS